MNLKKQAVAGLMWAAIASWGRQAIAFAVFVLLARVLDAKSFGLVSLAQVFLTFLQIFVNQGFSVAIVQKDKIESEHLDTAFWSNILVSIILTIVCIVGAGQIAKLFKQPEIELILQCLSINFILYSLSSVQSGLLQRKMLFKSLAIRSLISIVAGGIVGSLMALNGFGVWSLVSKQLAESLVGLIVLWGASDWRPGLKVSIDKFKELSAFGLSIIGIEITNFLNMNSDNFIIGYSLGSIALGYYSIGYKLLYVSTGFITGIVSNITFPSFSRLQNEPERLKNAFYKANKLSSVVNLPLAIVIALLAPEIVIVVFGEKWLPSVQVIQVFAFMGFYQSLMFLFVDVIVAMGKPHWRFRIMVLNSSINLLFFILAVPWGILAVALSVTLQSFLIATPLYFHATKKLIAIHVKEYVAQFSPAILSTLFMIITIFLFKQLMGFTLKPLPLLISSVLVGTLSYVAAMRFVDPTLFRYILDLMSKQRALG